MKVLIGIITYDSDWYCLSKFAESVNNLDCSGIDTEIYIVDNSDTLNYVKQLRKFFPKANIEHYQPPEKLKDFTRFRHCEIHCRNMIKDFLLKSNNDFLFFLDSDVICEKDVLQKLRYRQKDIVCGLFRYRPAPEGRPLWFRKKLPVSISRNTGIWFIDFITNEQVGVFKKNGHLMEIDACGFGAILINKDVLSRVNLRKSNNDHYGADINFCYDVKTLGYKIYGDPTAQCEHLYKQCERRRNSNARAF